jgi:Rrf2 family protein
MKYSTKCRYGMRAMYEIARQYRKSVVKRKDISRLQGISHGYLENILIGLKASHLIRPVRGANGGFELAKPPKDISMLAIIKSLEGSVAPVECVENPGVCERSGACPTRWVWKKLNNAQVAVLSGITLQDLLDKAGNSLEPDFAI